MKTIVFLVGGLTMLFATQNVNKGAQLKFNTGIERMIPDDEPIIVRGHVGNISGGNIVGASVKLKKNGVVTHQTTTNSSGDYQMSGVQAGTYVLHLSASGYVTKTIDLYVSSEINRNDTLIAE